MALSHKSESFLILFKKEARSSTYFVKNEEHFFISIIIVLYFEWYWFLLSINEQHCINGRANVLIVNPFSVLSRFSMASLKYLSIRCLFASLSSKYRARLSHFITSGNGYSVLQFFSFSISTDGKAVLPSTKSSKAPRKRESRLSYE